MTYKVIDPTGQYLTLEDDQPVPDGCRLAVEMKFMDSVQRAVHDDTDNIDDTSLTDTELAEQRRAAAYADYKQSLDTAYGQPPTARRQSLPPIPSWQRSPWRKPKKWEIGPVAPSDSAAPPVTHDGDPQDERRNAYEARSASYRDAHPALRTGCSCSPSSSSSRLDNLRKAFGDRCYAASATDQREAAYRERTAWLASAWRENRGG